MEVMIITDDYGMVKWNVIGYWYDVKQLTIDLLGLVHQ